MGDLKQKTYFMLHNQPVFSVFFHTKMKILEIIRESASICGSTSDRADDALTVRL